MGGLGGGDPQPLAILSQDTFGNVLRYVRLSQSQIKILQHTRQSLPTKNHPTQNVTSAKAEEAWFRVTKPGLGEQGWNRVTITLMVLNEPHCRDGIIHPPPSQY